MSTKRTITLCGALLLGSLLTGVASLASADELTATHLSQDSDQKHQQDSQDHTEDRFDQQKVTDTAEMAADVIKEELKVSSLGTGSSPNELSPKENEKSEVHEASAALTTDVPLSLDQSGQTDKQPLYNQLEADDQGVQKLTNASQKTAKTKTQTKSETLSKEVTSASAVGKYLRLRYNEAVSPKEEILFAVWTDYQNQDDLAWYRANAKGEASVDLSKHGEYGLYHIHTYSKSNGKMKGRNGRTIMVEKPTVEVSFEQQSDNNYRILISGGGDSLTGVTVPVWSDKDGQDDLHWYDAERQSDGRYLVDVTAAQHHYDAGHYSVHVYGQSAITGRLEGLSSSEGFYLTPVQEVGHWVFDSQEMIWNYVSQDGQVLRKSQQISAAQPVSTSNSFLNAIYEGSIASLQYGVLPSITAAQAILESGWGKSGLSMAPSNNLFGIKTSNDWTGQSVTVPTQEYINGNYITINAPFRKYDSWNDSVLDHAKFFTGNPWRKANYSDFVGQLDYRTAAQKLYEAGYATDPAYATKLIQLIEAYHLDEWDRVIS